MTSASISFAHDVSSYETIFGWIKDHVNEYRSSLHLDPLKDDDEKILKEECGKKISEEDLSRNKKVLVEKVSDFLIKCIDEIQAEKIDEITN